MTLPDNATRAELLKIARLLNKPAGELSFLADVPPGELRAFRAQVTGVLFDSHRAVLQRMAAASRLLPGPALAKIGERVFGPLLCARMASVVDAARGVDVAKRLSPSFLADVAAALDPRRSGDIIAGIPADLVRAVAAELVRREDWIAIAGFVDSLPADTMRAGMAEIDDAALPQITFFLDYKEDVDRVLSLLDRHGDADIARHDEPDP